MVVVLGVEEEGGGGAFEAGAKVDEVEALPTTKEEEGIDQERTEEPAPLTAT